MGRQINFFMVGEDEAEFIDFIHIQGDVIIDKSTNVMTKDEVMNEKFGQVYIKSARSRIIMWYDLFDHLKSEVIEYDRCRSKEKTIEAGRLYIQTFDLDENDNWVRKERWFEDKYNTYKRWIRKNFKISSYINYYKGMNKDKGFYIGKYTYRLYKEQWYKMTDNFKQDPELEFSIEFE